MSRNSRARRRLAAADVGDSVEFADFLDPVADPLTTSPSVAVATEPILEPVVGPVPIAEPEPVSRFADIGIDDDRLPLHPTKKRSRRH